jgi:Resolvase, N terminal domain
MKAPGSPPNQQQRKEANGKEVTMMFLKRRNIDRRDQESPRIWRAAIYMCEPNAKHGVTEPSVLRQRDLCRREATRLGAEVLGEFLDSQAFGLAVTRPGLYQALELAWKERLDYLIVSSLDRLADFDADLFEVAWHLGQAGTSPMEAMTEDD